MLPLIPRASRCHLLTCTHSHPPSAPQVRGAPREAVERTLAARRAAKTRLAAQLAEKREEHAAAAAQAHEDAKERVLRLRQEEVHAPRVKVFDPTESSGLALLNEMSLAETRERLAVSVPVPVTLACHC
jgi:hypothetical protein